jgi:hypothetical protein
MTPNMSRLHRAGLVALIGLLVIDLSGCPHRATSTNPPSPPNLGAALTVQFAWDAASEDNLGITRSVTLSGKQLSAPVDSRFVSCFSEDKQAVGCLFIDEFNTTSAYTPGPEYDGVATISNAQLGRWEVTASGVSSGGATATQTCSVNLDSSRLVTVLITMGVEPGCSVQ